MKDELGQELSAKLSALIALILRQQSPDGDFRRRIGEHAVLLRQFGLSHGEIAAILGSSEGSVKELVSRHNKQKPKRGEKRGK